MSVVIFTILFAMIYNREDVKNKTIFTYFGGSVYENQPIWGGVSLNFTRIWGGLLFSLKKGQNGGSVNIFHQIWPNYRENLLIFCFFLGGR